MRTRDKKIQDQIRESSRIIERLTKRLEQETCEYRRSQIRKDLIMEAEMLEYCNSRTVRTG